MRKSIICLFTSISLLLLASACKTTEANYRAAYERAVAGRSSDPDSTVYTKIRREMNYQEASIAGDTITIGTQYVRITENGGGVNESLKRYCVVAGQFKQVYTARSMRQRLVDNGYPGAFVVQTREPYYFVVAGAYNELTQAKDLADKLKNDQSLKIKAPLPFILNPAQLR